MILRQWKLAWFSVLLSSESCVIIVINGVKRMNKTTYETIRGYMMECMRDSAHDVLHVYRVLYQALAIAESYPEGNRDVLIASCLLHDIGRQAQFENPALCHAVEGAKMAQTFLRALGWEENLCRHVADCITSHRFRTDAPPQSIEAKILFDSDKLDATGALGIARSLIYESQVGEPLYTVDENMLLQDGTTADAPDSFLREYHFKLIRLYDRFYTEEAHRIAQKRKKLLVDFHTELLEEISLTNLDELLDIR